MSEKRRNRKEVRISGKKVLPPEHAGKRGKKMNPGDDNSDRTPRGRKEKNPSHMTKVGGGE